jgi:hypothetical protein
VSFTQAKHANLASVTQASTLGVIKIAKKGRLPTLPGLTQPPSPQIAPPPA